MSLFKRKDSPYWWIKIDHNGRRIQRSTGTSDKAKAQEYHDKLKVSLWDEARLGIKPRYAWKDAAIRYLAETSHKASQDSDKIHLRWLDRFLGGKMLDEINRSLLDGIMAAKMAEGVKNSTVNRVMEVTRAVLRKAANEWEWLDRIPNVRMLPEPNRRIRWITQEQAGSFFICRSILPQWCASPWKRD